MSATKGPDGAAWDGMAPVGVLVQEITSRCAINGCRRRCTVMVAVADQAGIVSADSLLVASSCREHGEQVARALGQTAVQARVRHDYPEATGVTLGQAVDIGKRDPAGPS